MFTINPIKPINRRFQNNIQNYNTKNNNLKYENNYPSSIYLLNFKGTDQYKKVSQARKIVEENSELINHIDPKTPAKFAITLKKIFDEKYKDYRIISVGTSPDTICQAMKKLGCEVINLPISGLFWLPDDFDFEYDLDYIKENYRNVLIAMDYLKYKGVNNKDNKKTIVMDFSCSGTTLDNVTQYINSAIIYNKDNIIPCDFLDTLDEYQDSKEFNNPKNGYTIEELKHYCDCCFDSYVEKISTTPHFYIEDSKNENKTDAISSKNKSEMEVFKEFENYSNPLADAFNTVVEYELEKMQK